MVIYYRFSHLAAPVYFIVHSHRDEFFAKQWFSFASMDHGYTNPYYRTHMSCNFPVGCDAQKYL